MDQGEILGVLDEHLARLEALESAFRIGMLVADQERPEIKRVAQEALEDLARRSEGEDPTLARAFRKLLVNA